MLNRSIFCYFYCPFKRLADNGVAECLLLREELKKVSDSNYFCKAKC